MHQAGIKALTAKIERRHDDCIGALYEMESASEQVLKLLDEITTDFDQLQQNQITSTLKNSDQQQNNIELF